MNKKTCKMHNKHKGHVLSKIKIANILKNIMKEEVL